MQDIKDSFYVALRDRMAVLAPTRVIHVHGTARPAIVAVENEMPDAQPPQPQTFYIRWQDITPVPHLDDAPQPLLRLRCEISYGVDGSDANSFQDRGRELGTTDDLL